MDRKALGLLTAGHMLIDLCQGTVPAVLPFLRVERGFSYTAAAGLVFAISAVSSLAQPLFGQLADRMAFTWILPASVALTWLGFAAGLQSTVYPVLVLSLALSGLGVSAFHPEAARLAHCASGTRRSTGMSVFSVGGGVGFALAPSLTRQVMTRVGTPGMLALIVPAMAMAVVLHRQFSRDPGSSRRDHKRRRGRRTVGRRA